MHLDIEDAHRELGIGIPWQRTVLILVMQRVECWVRREGLRPIAVSLCGLHILRHIWLWRRQGILLLLKGVALV